MNPQTLRASLPIFDHFELPKTDAVDNYLSHYHLALMAEGSATQQTIGRIEYNNHTLVGHAFYAKNAQSNALIVHGYMDHSGLYGKLIRHLLAQAINVFIVDLPGHGLSSGKQASIEGFEQYADAVTTFHTQALKNCASGPWFLFGQSMGGAIAMSLLQTRQLDITKTVLLAPLVQPRAWPMLKWAHGLLKHFISGVPRSFSDNSHNRAFTHFLKTRDTLQTRVIPITWINAMRSWRNRFLTQPPCNAALLVIQGTGDKTVDWHFGTRQIKRLFPNSEHLIVSGAKHHLVNEAVPYLQEVFDAIDRQESKSEVSSQI